MSKHTCVNVGNQYCTLGKLYSLTLRHAVELEGVNRTLVNITHAELKKVINDSMVILFLVGWNNTRMLAGVSHQKSQRIILLEHYIT